MNKKLGFIYALPFGEGGPLAVGEVMKSAYLEYLFRQKSKIFATFPRGEGIAASPQERTINENCSNNEETPLRHAAGFLRERD